MYRLIKVSGADAQSFLQGQLTQDVFSLADHSSMASAWCNPRGRVIATLRLLSMNDTIGLIVAADIAASVCENLCRFRFRANVEIELIDKGWHCLAHRSRVESAPLPLTKDVVVVEYASDMPITEYFGSPDGLAINAPPVDDALSDAEWQLALIHAGVPLIGVTNSEKFTPHMLNLDKLSAISFAKGCYTGQEIVARTQNLGTSKRRLMRYAGAANSTSTGDRLSLDGKNVGEVVNSSANQMLAVVPVTLQDRNLHINGTTVSPLALPYSIA